MWAPFKRLYDGDALLPDALRRLVAEHPRPLRPAHLRELAELQAALLEYEMTELAEAMYANLPDPAITPAAAYAHFVADAIEMVPVTELAGRVSTAVLVPVRPGLPVIMPGERFAAADSKLPCFVTTSRTLDARLSAFEA